jgi:hypothetical protein
MFTYVFYFRTGYMVSYFKMNFFGCITYNITYIYKLFHIFLIYENAACNNGVHRQLVVKYLLSLYYASLT